MKLFISADIEGCAGTTLVTETHKEEAGYLQFARQMTREVVAVCEAALQAGATEIVVKDGHGDAGNLDIGAMPEGVTLIRGKSGHPYNMMFGIDSSFDAVLFVGYHAAAGDDGSPLSHTSTGNANFITINGQVMSEFMLNSYTAAMMGVPVIFLSGDWAICQSARQLVPGIITVDTKKGVGASTINRSPIQVERLLKEQVSQALSRDFSRCKVELPSHFEYVINYKDLKKAYQMSFYPGMERLDSRTNCLSSDKYMEILTAHSFVV